MLENVHSFYENVEKCRTDNELASKLVVTVITICGSLGSPINLQKIYKIYNSNYVNYDPSFVLTFVQNSKNEIKDKKAFYNCLNIYFKYTDETNKLNNIAAKLFSNGSIQLPGCRTIESAHKVPYILYDFINKLSQDFDDIIRDKNLFKLCNVKIAMINSNFSFKNNIIQENLKNIINTHRYIKGLDNQDTNSENVWRIALFYPEKYSGVNAKYITNKCRQQINELDKIPSKIDGQVSVFIFRSGKCTITGAKNTADLHETYNAIISIVKKNIHSIIVE